MEQFISSVHKALAEKNWHAALFITLALPDICTRLESENDKTNGEKYAGWFDKYLKETYTIKMPGGPILFMSGDDCYVLRCSMLHQGFSDVSHQSKKGTLDKFHFSVLPQHLIKVGNVLHLNVSEFCKEVLSAVSTWFDEFKENHPDKMYKLEEMLVVHTNTYSVGGCTFTTGVI